MLDSDRQAAGHLQGLQSLSQASRQNATSSCSKSLNCGQVTRPSRGGVEKYNQK